MVVAAAAEGTIATVEEAVMEAAVEAVDGQSCDGSATEEWMIGRRAVSYWICPCKPRMQNTL